MTTRIINASAHCLPMIADGSIHVITTSPPYWGLRAYAGEPIPATVLDPFHGSGTSAQVSVANRRSYIGVDISAEYLDAHDRISGVQIKLI